MNYAMKDSPAMPGKSNTISCNAVKMYKKSLNSVRDMFKKTMAETFTKVKEVVVDNSKKLLERMEKWNFSVDSFDFSKYYNSIDERRIKVPRKKEVIISENGVKIPGILKEKGQEASELEKALAEEPVVSDQKSEEKDEPDFSFMESINNSINNSSLLEEESNLQDNEEKINTDDATNMVETNAVTDEPDPMFDITVDEPNDGLNIPFSGNDDDGLNIPFNGNTDEAEVPNFEFEDEKLNIPHFGPSHAAKLNENTTDIKEEEMPRDETQIVPDREIVSDEKEVTEEQVNEVVPEEKAVEEEQVNEVAPEEKVVEEEQVNSDEASNDVTNNTVETLNELKDRLLRAKNIAEERNKLKLSLEQNLAEAIDENKKEIESDKQVIELMNDAINSIESDTAKINDSIEDYNSQISKLNEDNENRRKQRDELIDFINGIHINREETESKSR